jgi:hypothetical protein
MTNQSRFEQAGGATTGRADHGRDRGCHRGSPTRITEILCQGPGRRAN